MGGQAAVGPALWLRSSAESLPQTLWVPSSDPRPFPLQQPLHTAFSSALFPVALFPVHSGAVAPQGLSFPSWTREVGARPGVGVTRRRASPH